MKAIVYASNTGYTAQYAAMLGEMTGLPVYTTDEACAAITAQDEVLYCSWLMAGTVHGYKKAAKTWNVKAVCAVGLCETGTRLEETRSAGKIPASVALFTVQGGYAPEKLHGIYKWMMKLVTRVLIKKIDDVDAPTDADRQMRRVLTEGGSYVCEDNLAAVLAYLNE